MSFPQLQAYIAGYQDHLFDLKCLAVIEGYWAGYYSSAKKPKPVVTVLNELLQGHKKSKKRLSATTVEKPEVDVDAFLKRERLFNERLGRR